MRVLAMTVLLVLGASSSAQAAFGLPGKANDPYKDRNVLLARDGKVRSAKRALRVHKEVTRVYLAGARLKTPPALARTPEAIAHPESIVVDDLSVFIRGLDLARENLETADGLNREISTHLATSDWSKGHTWGQRRWLTKAKRETRELQLEIDGVRAALEMPDVIVRTGNL